MFKKYLSKEIPVLKITLPEIKKNFQIEFPSFHKVRPHKGLIGFISFKIGKEYSWYQLAVHTLLKPKGNILIRIMYPEKQAPVSRSMQESIDEEVNHYLLAQYPELF